MAGDQINQSKNSEKLCLARLEEEEGKQPTDIVLIEKLHKLLALYIFLELNLPCLKL
jgi:hypothetical protein